MPRKTIGDSPLDALMPGQRSKPAPKTELPTRASKERVTIHLPTDLINQVKNAVWWTPGLTLAGLTEQALGNTLKLLEKKRGEPFPQREQELKAGRPLK